MVLAGGRGRQTSDSRDVAMTQICKEALPVWKCSDSWDKAVLAQSTQVVSVGGALDYTNNRGFVCCVLVGAGGGVYDADEKMMDLRKRILAGERPRDADNPYHISNSINRNSPWANMRFGANVSDKNGKATMKQKSGF